MCRVAFLGFREEASAERGAAMLRLEEPAKDEALLSQATSIVDQLLRE